MSSDLEPHSVLFGRYDIIQKLGEGTWSKVYLAHDRNVKRSVGIKHLKAKGDAYAIQRFQHEKEIIAQFKHSRIVTVHDFQEATGDEYFIIVEYIEGGSLKSRLELEGALAVIDALEMAIDICRALEAVHDMGIIHNDLKPGNVLLAQEEGRLLVKLSDFGSAAQQGTEAKYGPLPTGVYSGTFLYSSPELIREEICDGRSDLYSLGILLYEMLVGEVPFPFSGELHELFKDHFEKDPVPPSERRPGLCREANEVVLKALSKRPEMRYASAREMREALISAKQAQIEWYKELQDLYTQGINWMEKGQWQKAVAALEQVAKRHPDFEDAEQKLDKARAMDYCEKKEWEKAVELLEKITKRYPDDEELKMVFLYSEAVSFQEREQWTEVIKLFGQILAIDPSYRHVSERLEWVNKQKELHDLYTAAERLRFTGDWKQAIENLEKILEIDQEYKDATEKLQMVRDKKELNTLYARGMDYLEINKWNDAIECFEKAVLFVPTELDPETWPRVPTWALASVRLAQAKKLYAISTALDEGKRYLRNGRFKEAIARFDEILSLDRSHQEALQKREEAVQRLKRQIERRPGPTEPGVSPSLPLWEKIVIAVVVIALVVGLAILAAVNIAQVDVPQYVQVILGIALIGLGSFFVFRFFEGSADQ
jgi:tetratricopeptide (TPR) repeat protein